MRIHSMENSETEAARPTDETTGSLSGTLYRLIITEEEEGARIDRVLSLHYPELSRSYLQTLITLGNLQVNGQLCESKSMKVAAGQRVNLRIPPPDELNVEAEDIPLDIVYEDEDVLVVNKPRGMVVHPAVGNRQGTLVNAILYHCGDRLSTINGVVRPGIVHRIDKDTSGLLMIAKNDMAHEALSAQLEAHTINRRYVALVYDNLPQDTGTIDAPIGRDPKNRLRMAVTAQNSKKAVTHWRVLERFGRSTLIEARLETGRTHQIRVHMTYIQHPLVGDPLYGPKKKTPLTPAVSGLQGQLLHAQVLGFVHPRTGAYLEFQRPVPEEFAAVLAELRQVQSGERKAREDEETYV